MTYVLIGIALNVLSIYVSAWVLRIGFSRSLCFCVMVVCGFCLSNLVIDGLRLIFRS